MSHPFAGHSQNAVGKRRVKSLMRANGGEVTAKPVAKRARGGRLAKAAGGGVELGAKVEGKKAGGRLDRKARGGPIEKQLGGSIGRKLTPSKHKPHVKISIINNNARPKPKLVPVPVPASGGMGPGMAPGMPSPPSAPGGLPAPMQLGGVARPTVAAPRPVPTGPTNPRAIAALAARRPMPVQARPNVPRPAPVMAQMGGGVGMGGPSWGGPMGTDRGPPYSPTLRPTPNPISVNGPPMGGGGPDMTGLPPQAAALANLPDQAQARGIRGGFKRGGVVAKKGGGYISGVGTKGNLSKWADYAKKARGGSIQKGSMAKMDAGQGSGEGRLEQAHRQKRR